jgi:glycosyltransferase involved in cell wall biosynthesis
MSDVFPEISIIIPTHNSESTIKKCLLSLKDQEFPKEKYEIIVSDDGSTDQTLKLVKEFETDQIIVSEPCSPGKARNIGVKQAKGKILAFIDSDCEASPKWLSAIYDGLKKHDVITGTILNGNPKSDVAWAEYLLEFGLFLDYKKQYQVRFFPGCNGAMRKDTFEKTNGFPDEFISEDVLLGKNLSDLGFSTIFLPQVKIYHLCRTEISIVCANMKKLGKFGVRARKKDSSLEHANLYGSSRYTSVIFWARFLRCALNSFKVGKSGQFFKSNGFIRKCLTAYCAGIKEELQQN